MSGVEPFGRGSGLRTLGFQSFLFGGQKRKGWKNTWKSVWGFDTRQVFFFFFLPRFEARAARSCCL